MEFSLFLLLFFGTRDRFGSEKHSIDTGLIFRYHVVCNRAQFV